MWLLCAVSEMGYDRYTVELIMQYTSEDRAVDGVKFHVEDELTWEDEFTHFVIVPVPLDPDLTDLPKPRFFTRNGTEINVE